VNNPIRLSETEVEFRRDAPSVGEHTLEILKETGYTDDDIRRLVEKGVIVAANRGAL
jgi:crotonobetainyl-CoA:carnitine CoA-transferase CaiB-like acyl-CoA transferase